MSKKKISKRVRRPATPPQTEPSQKTQDIIQTLLKVMQSSRYTIYVTHAPTDTAPLEYTWWTEEFPTSRFQDVVNILADELKAQAPTVKTPSTETKLGTSGW